MDWSLHSCAVQEEISYAIEVFTSRSATGYTRLLIPRPFYVWAERLPLPSGSLLEWRCTTRKWNICVWQ